MSERIDKLDCNPFISSPAELICASIKKHLQCVEQFKCIFSTSIDDYLRMDYSIRELPALRIYNETMIKEFDSWFINGDITVDVIFPASLRRTNTQRVQDIVSSALLQQFRRTTFFNNVRIDVPGLNELGKVFTVDKSLGFRWEKDIVPMTQIKVNFRVDLREWDTYLETNCRTKDDPFDVTLGELNTVVTTIQALNDDDTLDLSLSLRTKT